MHKSLGSRDDVGTLGRRRGRKGAHHGERVTEGDEADAALGICCCPLGEGELGGVLAEDGDVTPTLASEAFSSDVQERFAEIDEVDGIELRDGEMFIHELDVVTWMKMKIA